MRDASTAPMKGLPKARDLFSLAEARSLVIPGKRVARVTMIAMALRREIVMVEINGRYFVPRGSIAVYRRAHGYDPI